MSHREPTPISIIMTLLVPLLMTYSLIGETFHEVCGIAAFILFLTHHAMNRGWHKRLLSKEIKLSSCFRDLVVILLTIFMIAQPVSGFLMSKHLLPGITIAGAAATARRVHLCLAYWGVILLGIHIGQNLRAMTGALNRKEKRPGSIVGIASAFVIILVSVYGVYSFFKRGFIDYMFMRINFAFIDYSEPWPVAALSYLSVMALFTLIGAAVDRMLRTHAA